MKRLIVLLMFVVPVCILSARSIPGADNEVWDPWFEEQFLSSWYIQGNNWILGDNPGNLPGNYFDPGRNPGDTAFLRTIVDDWEGLWNPEWNNKEIDFSLFAHIVGDGYVVVGFDWWDDPEIPRPTPEPDLGPIPDGWSKLYIASNFVNGIPGDFQNRPDLVLPGEEPGWFTPDGDGSFLLNIHEIWDHQPRWVSIEIWAGVGIPPIDGETNPIGTPNGDELGGEALITGIDFQARCVPEPASLFLVFLGLAMVLVRRGMR